MKTITLKSDSPETVAPLLKNAVEREEKIIMDTIRKSKEKINSLTKTLGVDTGKLMK